ncbi:MAG TPA: helicase-related protein, partial [Hyphomicrobiaceae bacterium]|nr:helicase-related protein [Hyphomicrobiaceae bacterium]
MAIDHTARIRHVTAVLGPTNTGKTHLAIERMLDHDSGMIGLPLRLLAREVYDKVSSRVGAGQVALVTGEEKIKPEGARYWICTVEAMPRDIAVDFLAIDEVQLAADPERGHVFTDRLLHMRGQLETLVLGAGTMREAITDLIPGSNFIARPRLSKLTYAGQKKITRLPARSAVVAFSASEVYAIAELIRRQRGGAAVVLGALSPRTRNAQVALYQSGDVDFLVATDAVGMGLNLDVDHVAFSAIRKFDGYTHRNLTPSELGQIAGRAGRHMNDGTFGVTGDVEPFEADLIERLESHTFEPVKTLQWRTTELDFGSLDALRDSLRRLPNNPRLMRARMADDVEALENVANDRDVLAAATNRPAVERLWEVCQIPDYRKISSQNHAEMVATVYGYLTSTDAVIADDWFAKQVAFSDKVDGDIDTLSNRLAHIRTWTFVANRVDWLKDPEHWQERTRQIEDNLSDALHERLTQRFVDKRTSALMKGLRADDDLSAEIAEDGAIHVEQHYVGRLKGFRFSPDTEADGIHGKAARHAAVQVLAKELLMRVRRVVAAKDDAFRLHANGQVQWRDEIIGMLEATDDPLKPQVSVLCDEHLAVSDREKVQERLANWINASIAERLRPLVEIAKAEDISGLARGIAFRLTENLGVLRREAAAGEIKSLDQTARSQLRKYGMRFGAFNLFFPVLLKPAAADLLLSLWCLKYAEANGLDREALPQAPRAGLTSVAVEAGVPAAFYQAYGFHVCGPRAVRIDILERLADLIRPLLSWRATEEKPDAPKGSTGEGGFTVTPEMMSILGCSPDELGSVLKSLGFRSEQKPAPVPVVPVAAKTELSDVQGQDVQSQDVQRQDEQSQDEQSSAGAAEPAPEPGPDAAPAEVAAGQAGADDVPSSAAVIAAEDRAAEMPDGAVPSGETDQPPTDIAVAVATPAPDEPKMIEVWRPGRRQDGGRRPRGPRQRDDATSETRRGDGGRRQGGHPKRPNSGEGQPQRAEGGRPGSSGAPRPDGAPSQRWKNDKRGGK